MFVYYINQNCKNHIKKYIVISWGTKLIFAPKLKLGVVSCAHCQNLHKVLIQVSYARSCFAFLFSHELKVGMCEVWTTIVLWVNKKSCDNFVFHYVFMQLVSFCLCQIIFYAHFYVKLEGKKGRWRRKRAWINS